MFRRLRTGILLALLATGPARGAVVVSSKLSSESALIGQMIRLVLNAHGVPTVDRMRLGTTPVVREALLSGEIDLYVEYTGDAAFFYNQPTNPAWQSLEAGYRLGAALDFAAHRIVWLTPAPADDAWALAVRRDVATAQRLRTMSDFGRWVRHGGDVVLACSAEFANGGTLAGLERAYRFHLRSSQMIVLSGGETAATIAAAAAGTDHTNTAMVYGTDGGIVAANLVLLADDRHAEPIYAPVPIVRAAVLARYPRIREWLRPLMRSLDGDTLRALNARVQIDGESARSVAASYLAATGLAR